MSLEKAISQLFNPDQDFFTIAADAKRLPHLVIAIPLPVIFILLGVITSEILILKYILGDPSFSPLVRELYSFTVTVFLVILLLWAWIKFIEQRPFNTIGLQKKSVLKHYSYGFITGMIMMSCVVGLIALTGHVDVQSRSADTSIDSIIGSGITMLLAYMVQGANEEIISRGWHLQIIGKRYSPWLGVLISSLIFALLHVGAKGADLLAFLNLLLFSLLLVMLVLKHQSIWAACGWHSAWNWTMGTVFGLEVSGRNQSISILKFSVSGSKLISGGEYGPEGSLMATIVLLGGILILLLVSGNNKIDKTLYRLSDPLSKT